MKCIGDILTRNKTSLLVEDDISYKQVTIRTNYKGVVLRGSQFGLTILTKNQFRVSAGQFILSRIDARNGAFGIIPDELEGAIVTNDFLAFDINEDEVDRDFFNVFLQSPVFLEACIKASRGNTNRKRIQEFFFLNYQVDLPLLREQQILIKQIKQSRSSIAIAQQEITQQETLLEQLQQAILQEAIQGQLTAYWRAAHLTTEPASQLLHRIQIQKNRLIAAKKLRREKPLPKVTPEEIPFVIPKGWEWCRVGDLGDSARGKTPKYSEGSDSVILNQKCIRWNSIDLTHAKCVSRSQYDVSDESTRTKAGDLLVNSTGEGTIGRSAIITVDSEGLLYDTHVLKFRPFDSSLFFTSYLMNLINSAYGQKRINAVKGAQTTKQTELGTKNLNFIPIPLPPLDEQVAIVARLEVLQESCRVLAAEIEHVRIHTTNLLQAVRKKAFTEKVTSPKTADVQLGFAGIPTNITDVQDIIRNRAALDAYILVNSPYDKFLGRTKMEKENHFAEYEAGLGLRRNALRDAAGPVDFSSRLSVEAEANKQNWYSVVKHQMAGGKNRYEYIAGKNIATAIPIAEQFMGDRKQAVDRLINLLKPLDTDKCSIIATLYAAWNDLLLFRKPISDQAIIKESSDNWHREKKRILPGDWNWGLNWLLSKDVIPKGRGKPILPKR